jgi:hypothetical protein
MAQPGRHTTERIEGDMKTTAVLVACASLLLFGCGGSDDDGGRSAQTELADLLVENESLFDEECIRDKTGELTDDDAQFLVDNIDAADVEGFSENLQAWVDTLIDCVPGAVEE